MFYSYEAQVPEIANAENFRASPVLRNHRIAPRYGILQYTREADVRHRAAWREWLAQTAEYRRGCGALRGGTQFEGSLGRARRGVSRRLRAEESIFEKAIKRRVRTRHIIALSRILIELDGFLSLTPTRSRRFFLSFGAGLSASAIRALLQNSYSAGPANEHLFRQPKKQPVLDDADGFRPVRALFSLDLRSAQKRNRECSGRRL